MTVAEQKRATMTVAQLETDLPRVGVLGGSFDPIHNGHLIIAESLREQLNLTQLLFLLSPRPPHKNIAALAPWQDRKEMIRLASKDNPHFQICDVEIKRSGLSYTAETIQQLTSRYGAGYRILFIVGADSILDISTWHKPEQVLASRSLVVVPRPGYDLDNLDPAVVKQVTVVQIPLIEISSSDIRQRIKEGRSIRYLLPLKVAAYIHQHDLYR